jgi:hypothetical protein
LFVTLQQNCVAIKVENDDDLIEENSIDVINDEVYTSSACSVNEAVPKVRFVLR